MEKKKWDVDASDFMGGTALIWAAVRGQEGAVKVALEREDFNLDQAGTGYGRTPPPWVAGSGHGGLVKMPLRREDVNPNHAETLYHGTPLS